MGKCCSCCPRSSDRNSSQALLNKDGPPTVGKQESVLVYDPNSKQKPFRRWIELAFYAFAGSSKSAKKQGIYMSKGIFYESIMTPFCLFSNINTLFTFIFFVYPGTLQTIIL